jgi:tungstate transport system substrate-binding protein
MTLKNCSNIFILISTLLFANTAFSNNKFIRVATTTSTENSGLLKYLTPNFEKRTGYKLHFIAVGTGKALQMGRDGDVDLMLVHAKPAEEKIVSEGYGIKRYPVMYNDFVIVGPKKSKATFADKKTIKDVLETISSSKSKFVSRGDDSGTHKKELSLWKQTKNIPNNKSDRWYIEAGQGMGKVLQMAGEMEAYTITDRGTWLAYMNKTPLSIVFEGNPILFNPYGMIAVNPEKYPDTNTKGAQAFIDWMTSAEGQALIGNFKISGKVLFIPNAGSE